MKIWGVRSSLIGDSVMALPILEVLEKKYPNSYKYYCIAKKCQQCSKLFANHPLINEIKISDYEESLGESDFEIIKNCDLVINVSPPHPQEQDWYNYRNCVEETALMAGINPLEVKNIKPRLYLEKDIKKLNNTIAIWPFAGYGQGIERSPNLDWWKNLFTELNNNNYKILHCGTNNEPEIGFGENYTKITNLEFIEQIYTSLGCNGVIGTDSGSMWVTAAYHKTPQINLITNWLPNHKQNLLALAPVGDKAYNLYADNGCSNITINSILKSIDENFCL